MKRLLLAALLVPGAASANIITIDYWATVAHDFGGGGTEGNSIQGRFEINTALAPHGDFQPGQALYQNRGDSPLFIDRSGFITDPNIRTCGCSLDSLLISDAAGPTETDVLLLVNYERLGGNSFIRQELEFQSNDLFNGTSLDQNLSFDQAPTTFGRLIVEGVSGSFLALLDRVRAVTHDAPGSCHK